MPTIGSPSDRLTLRDGLSDLNRRSLETSKHEMISPG